MTYSNIDLIKNIKYKYTNTNNGVTISSTHSFHTYMNNVLYTTQSISEKINNFKEIIGYTNSSIKSLTHSFTYSSIRNFSFTGLTNSNIHFNSYLGGSSSNIGTQSYSFNNSIGTYSHRFFTKVTNSIKKLDNQPFANIVSVINSISLDEAKKLIISKKVTVNGLLITDINFKLSSLDIIRIGFEGHFLNNPHGIAIIK